MSPRVASLSPISVTFKASKEKVGHQLGVLVLDVLVLDERV